MLEAAEDKEDLIDVLQVIVIQDQSFKAGQWFEELLLQGLEMIEADTQLPEIWQIVKSVSVNVWDDIVWQIEVFEMWQFWKALFGNMFNFPPCEREMSDMFIPDAIIIIMGPQPVTDSVPGQGGAVLTLGVRLQDLGEAGDHRDQRHQEHRGQHGGGGARPVLGFQ